MADIKIELESENGKIVVGKEAITSVSSLSQTTSNPNEVSYGSLSNSGTIELFDAHGDILRQIEDIGEKIKDVNIYCNSGLIQKHRLDESSYASDEKKASLSLYDGIDSLNINLPDIYIKDDNGYRNLERNSLYNLSKALFVDTGLFSQEQFEHSLSKTVIRNKQEISVRDLFLNKITIEFPYFLADTLRNNIDKICSIAQMSFVVDNQGEFVFVDARPVYHESKKTIFVPLSKVFEPLSYDPLSKTKIDSVGFEMNKQFIERKELKKFGFTFYEQSDNSEKETIASTNPSRTFKKVLYGNNWDDYREKVSTNDSSSSFLSSGYARQLILKTEVTLPQITDFKKIFINYKNLNLNYYNEAYNLDATSNNRPVLFNTVFSEHIARYSSYYAKFLNTEDEAIAYVKGSASTNIAEACFVKKDGDTYNMYVLVNTGLKFAVNPSTYPKGEIRMIYLNGEISIDIECVSSEPSTSYNPEAKYIIPSNELMQYGNKYGDTDIYSFQSANISSDYSSGLLYGKITVGCFDYFYDDGSVAKTWINGEIIKKGDVISVQGDYNNQQKLRRWVVVGSEFNYDSEPLNELEILEIKEEQDPVVAGLYSSDGTIIASWPVLEMNGTISITNNEITYADKNNINGRLVFPENVLSVANGAFSDCYGLTGVDLKNVNNIGEKAFKNCSSITTLTIPESVQTIGNESFYGLTSLSNIQFNSVNAEIKDIGNNNVFSFAGNNTDGVDVVFGDAVQAIPKSLFRASTTYDDRFPNIKYVKFGKNIKSIGFNAFYDCQNLTAISEFPETLTEIGVSAFGNCSSLSGNIVIPDSVITIGSSAFAKSSISGVVWGAGITTIPEYCFDYCSSLSSVDLGKVESIGKYAFWRCNSLTEIKFPNTLKSIGENAFSSCTALKSPKFPESLVSIASDAFESCLSFVRISLPFSLKTLSSSAFYGCSNITGAFVPSTITSMGTPFLRCYPTMQLYVDSAQKPSSWPYYWNQYGDNNLYLLTVNYGWTKEQFDALS